MNAPMPPSRIFPTLADLYAQRGLELGPGQWMVVEQPRIDLFAEASGDDSWVHTDVDRAARELPGGRTYAHGYLGLSLITALSQKLWRVGSLSQALLYGVDECRFPAPVRAGDRVRLRQKLEQAEWRAPNALKVGWRSVLEVEGSDKPACAARTISLLFERMDRGNE